MVNVSLQDTSNAAFAAARQYSQIAKEIYDAKIKENPEIMKTIKNKRAEIRSRNTGADANTVGSLDEAKYWFENMTYFQVHCIYINSELFSLVRKNYFSNSRLVCSHVLYTCPFQKYFCLHWC